ncbi:hypothetical protein QR721_09555 [Aciduricibacillus chroicocephali]|uniref:Spore coat protein YutH n=1 Tax=Aciduricibacillus chroicocephali TaxID=3054939 RepID=A0ABY9KSW5_9BACI|nr:hypothetical protein QR721_09555 [Bacillaceae bacterium 44XB]
MYELLVTDYALDIRDTTSITGRHCFCDEQYAYFTICIENKEAIFAEQAILASFLKENGCRGTAWPIRNVEGEWYSVYKGKRYFVCCAEIEYFSDDYSEGELLAHFHKQFSHYPYEPQNISCYGEWRMLWENKLGHFESELANLARSGDYCASRLMDVFSYLIGLGENAIQYVRESEEEQRFGETDQATIVFERYQNQLLQPVIWPDELLYDHPVRDVAEWVRGKLLEQNEGAEIEVVEFLRDYQTVSPLSVFGWRLLYARLMFPAHFFDLLEELPGLQSEEDEIRFMEKMSVLCRKQKIYEQRLKSFFEIMEVDVHAWQIPRPEWLAT